MVSRDDCTRSLYLKFNKKNGEPAGSLILLESISRILRVYLGLHLLYIFISKLCICFGWINIIIAIKMKKILWLYVVFVSHTESRCPSRDALQLILKHVAPAVALNDKQNFPPHHLIQILVAVAPNLAYDRFEGFVGVCPFFRCPSPFSSISFSMVEGIATHSARISITVLIMSMISAREAE